MAGKMSVLRGSRSTKTAKAKTTGLTWKHMKPEEVPELQGGAAGSRKTARIRREKALEAGLQNNGVVGQILVMMKAIMKGIQQSG
eukprot:4385600-Karenia_brevis.AAC.1